MSVNVYGYVHIYMCVHVSVHVYLNVDNSVGAFGRQGCWILLKLVTGGSNLLHVLAGNYTQVLRKSSFSLDLNCIIFSEQLWWLMHAASAFGRPSSI